MANSNEYVYIYIYARIDSHEPPHGDRERGPRTDGLVMMISHPADPHWPQLPPTEAARGNV